ncbi:MAG: stage V sporulation protein AD [Oscillospiraceae bacterium]|nr:stage V sporulation protein AD [Oscillospiraceae bacterium]
MKRIGNYTLELENHPYLEAFGAVGGKKEKEGPLGEYFDKCFIDTTLGQDTWEQSESKLQTEASQLVLEKGSLTQNDIQYVFSGDLLNQCISSTFGLRTLNIPFLGQFGACSTMGQALAMASIFVESGAADRAMAVTSSHFCSAERQFRFPLEYGGQRTPTAQWTVTGAGAVIVAGQDVPSKQMTTVYPGVTKPKRVTVSHITVGRITDLGVKDANNMGAAMAPAAAQTIADYLEDTNTSPQDYDLILTGDLGQVGSELLEKLLRENGIFIGENHNDCGLLIYDRQKQDVHAGGSGCGCAASVSCIKLFPEMAEGLYHNVLFVPTGALMSPTSSQQGASIPSIAHLVHLTAE